MTSILQGGGSHKRLDISFETCAAFKAQGATDAEIHKHVVNSLVFFNNPNGCVRIPSLTVQEVA